MQKASPDFTLVLGGPFYRLLLRSRLARSPLQWLPRRILAMTALCWGPLLLLAAWDGRAIGGVSVPLLSDLETYARFMLAMPLLMLAENAAQARLPGIVEQFRERGIVSLAQAQFDEAVVKATARANSTVAEVVMFALAVIAGPWLWRNGLALQTDTWYADIEDGGIALLPAGWWLVHVSAPLFQFLLLRWYYRLAIWWRFLWEVSRLPLRLVAVHPDRAGGIGFLGDGAATFMTVLFAQGAVLSGFIASRVLFGGASALDYRGHIALIVACLVATVIVPLFFFAEDIGKAQREGMRRYGALATAYSRDFEQKWFGDQLPAGEPLLGNADVQSLADLAGAGDIVREMRMLPLGLRTLLLLLAAAAAPFLPLVLTVIPLAELLREAVVMLL